MAISPDGHHVYATDSTKGAVVLFKRHPTTGKLTFGELQQNGVDGVRGLSGASMVTLSLNGQQLFVAGINDDAVMVFNRDLTSGALTFIES